MSVTLKQGLMKYKNGQGEFVSINSIGEETTAQQVSEINSAGAEQIAAVQQKGEQTIASIPSDYTNLSNEVDDLKSTINEWDSTIKRFNVTATNGLDATKEDNRSTDVGTGKLRLDTYSGFTSYWFYAKKDSNVFFFDDGLADYVAISIGTNPTGTWQEMGASIYVNCDSAVRYRLSENNLPRFSSPVSVKMGDLIAVTVKGGTNSAYIGLIDADSGLMKLVDDKFTNRGTVASPATCGSLDGVGYYFISSDYLPSDWVNNTTGGILLNYYSNDIYKRYQMAIVYASGNLFFRNYTGTQWSAWHEISEQYIASIAANSFSPRGEISSGTCGDVTGQGFYYISTSYIPLDWPDQSNGGVLLNYYNSSPTRRYQQAIIYGTNEIYTRNYQSSYWKPWVKTKQNNTFFRHSANGNEFRMECGKIEYVLAHTVNNNINLDIWRMYQITYGGSNTITDTTTDIEGPILEHGAADFIGGFHGDEQLDSIKVLLNNVPIALTDDYSVRTRYETLTFYIESTLYRANTITPVIKRNVKIEFENNKLTISNHFKFIVDNFVVDRATSGGLLSIYNSDLNAISFNSDYSCELAADIDATNDHKSKDLTEVDFFTDFGAKVRVKNIIGKENPHYIGFIQHFTWEQNPRIKAYLDVISESTTFNTGDSIRSEFEIIID